jgi:hypothetical protein
MHMKLHGWKTVSGLLFSVSILAVGGGSTGAQLGCSSSSGDDGSSSGGGSSGGGYDLSAPANCTTDDTIDCSGGGTGFSCDSGDNPEAEDSTYDCSEATPDSDGVHDDFCCFTGFSGTSSSCVSDDDITVSCSPDTYGFQCDSGDDPSSLDPTLDDCSMAEPDPDGVHDDFCCDLSGSGPSSSSGGSTSSGGSVPANCTADDSIDCSGGGDGYSCDSGDDPESESDGTLSCSQSTPDADGVHDDFCCISFDGSSSSCVADDDLDCTAGDAYGYQCDMGDDPTSLDSSLNCSDPTADSDGVHTDYCCN